VVVDVPWAGIVTRLLLALLLCGYASSADAVARTVDPDGGRDHTTIAACIKAMSPGDSCDLYAGTYSENPRGTVSRCTATADVMVEVDKSGRNDQRRITIRAMEPGVIIDGGGTANVAFGIYNNDYVTIDGQGFMTLQNFQEASGHSRPESSVLEIFGCSNSAARFNIFRNITITNIECSPNETDQGAVYLWGNSQDNRVENITFDPKQSGAACSGIRGSNGDRNVFSRNSFTNVYVCIYVSQAGDDSQGHTYEYNYCNRPALVGFWVRDHYGTTVRGNIARGGSDKCQYLFWINELSRHANERHRIYHNVADAQGECESGIVVTSIQGIDVANNIVLNGTRAGLLILDNNPETASTGTIHHNLSYNNCQSGHSSCADSRASVTNGPALFSNILTNDPQFVASGNIPSPYYRLQSTSPAKDSGDAAVPGGRDYDGNAVSTSPDMGAFEVQLRSSSAPAQ
jgi:hypothetical protein